MAIPIYESIRPPAEYHIFDKRTNRVKCVLPLTNNLHPYIRKEEDRQEVRKRIKRMLREHDWGVIWQGYFNTISVVPIDYDQDNY